MVSFDELCVAIGQVPDPEVPVLTIEDLGILRDIQDHDGTIVVTLTPTYSGCPAIQFIEDSVQAVMADAGYINTEIKTVFSPAWTTEWMSEEGKTKLKAFGIAPPHSTSSTAAGAVSFTSRRPVRCPQCDSADTRVVSEFGSTACKALYSCNTCSEPFDYFKEI